MEFEQVLKIADEAVTRLRRRGLNDVERTILQGSWTAQSYADMAVVSGYSETYLKQDVGPKLWKSLTEALGRKVSKKTLKTAFELYVPASDADLLNGSIARSHPTPLANPDVLPPPASDHSDWEELAIDVSEFYGRHDERSHLASLVLERHCRLVVLHGMKGIGKTWLSQRVKQQVQSSFTHVICLLLQQQPSPTTLLAKLLQELTQNQDGHSSHSLDGQLTRLMRLFSQHACLVVLDDGDAVFQEQTFAGRYRNGYEDYGKILRQIAATHHQSCVIWVSQAEPEGLADVGNGMGLLPLSGFSPAEGREWLQTKSNFVGAEAEWTELIERCSGHPVVLQRIVSRRTMDTVGRQLAGLLEHWPSVIEQVQALFAAQFNQLADVEQQVMYWLAIAQTPLTFKQLQSYRITSFSTAVMESLVRRSLCISVQSNADQSPRFVQPPIVMAYVLHRVLATVREEIDTETIVLLNSHALLITQAPDYVQKKQRHLILDPLIEHIHNHYSSPQEKLRQLLTRVGQTFGQTANYAIGNLINLYQQINPDLSDFDFSGMTIRQADFRRAVLHGTNFDRAQIQHSIFAQAIGGSMVLAFSPDSRLLATGNEDGKTFLWDVSDDTLTLKAHYQNGSHAAVRAIALDPDLSTLAVGSDDHTVQLWDIRREQPWNQTLHHPASVRSVCFSPDRRILASSSDGCIYLWDSNSGRPIRTLAGHVGEITDLCFDESGHQLLSCGDDQTVRLWTVTSGELQQTFPSSTNSWQAVLLRRSHAAPRLTEQPMTIAVECNGRTMRLWSVETDDTYCTLLLDPDEIVVAIAISANGQRVASSSIVSAQTHPSQPSNSPRQHVKLWDVPTQQCLRILSDVDHSIQALTFSPDGHQLATGSDRHLALWDVETGRCLSTLRDPREPVLVFSFNHDHSSLITGQQNHAIRLWDIQSGRCHQTLLGHDNWVRVLAASPDGRWLASSSSETIRLWDMQTGVCCARLSRQPDPVRVLCFSPTDSRLASGADDATITLWDIQTRQPRSTLQGHHNRISALCFSPDGRWLASGSYDYTVRVWDAQTGATVFELDEHDDRIHSLSISADGQTLVSASRDHVVKCWNLATGECQVTWHRPDEWVHAVQMDAVGRAIAISSSPGSTPTLQLWDVQSDVMIQTLSCEQVSTIWCVTFSANGEQIAIGTNDGLIHVWHWQTRQYLNALRTGCPYEGMNIQDMTLQGNSLSPMQVETLKQLGAIER